MLKTFSSNNNSKFSISFIIPPKDISVLNAMIEFHFKTTVFMSHNRLNFSKNYDLYLNSQIKPTIL